MTAILSSKTSIVPLFVKSKIVTNLKIYSLYLKEGFLIAYELYMHWPCQYTLWGGGGVHIGVMVILLSEMKRICQVIYEFHPAGKLCIGLKKVE